MASIMTDVGKAKLASATPLDQLNVTQIAVGDGNGGYPVLLPEMTTLTNEVWRGGAAAPIRDPNDDKIIIFEGFIPANSGGFEIREMAIFDDDGDMIAIGHTSLIEKPLPGSGSGVSLSIRMHIALESASQVDLIFQDAGIIDHAGLTNRSHSNAHPASSISTLALSALGIGVSDLQTVLNALKSGALNPIVASQVDETVNALLTNGYRGIGKRLSVTNADTVVRSGFYDLESGAGNGAAIDGEPGALLVIDAGDNADECIQLWIQSTGGSSPAIAVREGDGATITTPWVFLQHSSNNEMVGAVLPFITTVQPKGYLKANGAAVSRTAYADLFAKVGTFWGVGDGSTTFNLPDLRGEFIRGFDDGRGLDAGRSFGDVQSATAIGMKDGSYGNNVQSIKFSDGTDGTTVQNPASMQSGTDTFTYYTVRPRNIALMYHIKY